MVGAQGSSRLRASSAPQEDLVGKGVQGPSPQAPCHSQERAHPGRVRFKVEVSRALSVSIVCLGPSELGGVEATQDLLPLSWVGLQHKGLTDSKSNACS